MEPNNPSNSGDNPEPTPDANAAATPNENAVPAEVNTTDATPTETPVAAAEDKLLEPATINTASTPGITPSTTPPDTSVKPDQPAKPKKAMNKKMVMIGGLVGAVIIAVVAYFVLFSSSSSTYADLQVTTTDVYVVQIPEAWATEETDDGTYYYSGETLDESNAFIVISDLGFDPEIQTIVGLEGQDKADALSAMAAIMEGLIEAGLTSEFEIDETSSEVLESENADTAIKVSFTGTIKSSGLDVNGAYLYLLQSDGTTMFINISAETSIWNGNQSEINAIFDSFKPAA